MTEPEPPDRHPDHFPGWIWPVYVALFTGSVPWYMPRDAPLRIWFGLPHWVVISLASTLAVAVFTWFVVHHFWPALPDDADEDIPQ